MIRIGTAGWAIPAQLRPDFPGDGQILQRYGAIMPAVEINSSFYRPHQTKTYARWAAMVPDDFRFAVKLPRSVTQDARLRGCDTVLTEFLAQVHGLGPKLGVLLVQLPPSLPFDAKVTADFFRLLADQTDAAIACEPRHASWFASAADALLREHHVARVAADPPRDPADGVPGGARTRLAYFRLHGSPRIYWSAYDDARLRRLAAHLQEARAKEVWCIFDNTAGGAALADARRLQALLHMA